MELTMTVVLVALAVGSAGNATLSTGTNEEAAVIETAPQPQPTPFVLDMTGLIKPRAIHQPQPPFPKSARNSKGNGVVIIEIQIKPDGTVRSASLVSGDPVFVESALATLRTWRYEPLLVNGTPIQWTSKVILRFKPRE